MRNFQLIGTIDPLPVVLELGRQPELWNAHRGRLDQPGSPHAGVDDIWIRWRPGEAIDNGAPHTLEFLEPWYRLPALRPIVFTIMARTQAVQLGGVLITRIPAGGRVLPHVDRGWHPEWFNQKAYCVLQGNPQCLNHCEHETVAMEPGSVWSFRNTLVHSVVNDGADDRVSLIVCMRCEP